MNFSTYTKDNFEVKTSTFAGDGSNGEIHAIVTTCNPLLTFQEQLEAVAEGVGSITTQNNGYTPVFVRLMLSDAANQAESAVAKIKTIVGDAALAYIEQPPLHGARIAALVYLRQNVEIERVDNFTVKVSANGYTHFYTANCVFETIETYLETADQLWYLEKMLKNEKMTADERYQVRLKLKNLTDKLNDKDKQKADEKKKKEEQRNNDRYNNYLKTIDNKKALDQLSLKSEIASYNYMLKYFKLTEDQKTEILKRRYNAENQLRQKNQELAKAAYEKLVNDKISSLEKENEAIQKNADKRIKAIDDEINKRKQQNDDDSRQKELDSINAQLRYAQLDSVTRMELERRKQNILNEQAEIDWEREQEAKKTQIQEKADQRVAANTKAIENLSNVLEKFGNALAKMYGTQTTTQIVNNNSKSANINLVKNGMTDQQLLKKFLKVFYN